MTTLEFKTAYSDAAKTEAVMIAINDKAFFDDKTISHAAWVAANTAAADHFDARISYLEERVTA
jgi:hypothetical protein